MSENSNEVEPESEIGSEVHESMKKIGRSEEKLEKIPRRDGIVEPDWDPNDIGFFLPSHYFEREDGETFRSLRESDDTWRESVADMSCAVSRMRQEHSDEYVDLFAEGSSRQARSRAIGIFLADLFIDGNETSHG